MTTNTIATYTRLLEQFDVTLLLDKHGLQKWLNDLIVEIENDYKRWEQFEKSARTANHLDGQGVIELMPISDSQTYGFKYVNGHPYNQQFKLPTVMAFGAYADLSTGFPLLISDLTLVTAWRTAATSVIAAKRLANTSSKSMALIGNGAQCVFQAYAFYHELGIRIFHLYDPDVMASEKVKQHIEKWADTHVILHPHVQSAVENADIVTTITADKKFNTIIENEWARPGTHYNAVGGDCPGKTELDPRILLQSAGVVVEYEPQSRIEGEIQRQALDFQVTHLHEILRGKSIRKHQDDITVFDSVGFALEDFSTLRLLLKLSSLYNIGRTVDLVCVAPDPKDLWSMQHLSQT